MAAEVAEGRQQLGVVEVVDVDLDPLAQLPRVGAQEPLVLLVGHPVDPGAQVGALLQQRAVLDHHRVPAGGLEHRGETAGGDVGDDAVQRLAVEVDDPHHLAEARDHRVRDRLPAGALVELGVADQRDLAPAAGDVEVPGDVAVRERAPDRRGGAEADGAGRVVDRVGVLRAARVGLQAAVLAQRRQIAAVEAAEQVVDGVQDRARVRLDADPVRRLERRRSTAPSSGSPCSRSRPGGRRPSRRCGSRGRGWRGGRCWWRARAPAAGRGPASGGRSRWPRAMRAGGYSVKQ